MANKPSIILETIFRLFLPFFLPFSRSFSACAATFHAGLRPPEPAPFPSMPQSRLPVKTAASGTQVPQNTDGLRNIGLKATGPRLRILELFQTSGTRHMSAEDVYRQLLSESIEVGLATVYRVLTQFEQAGLLQRHHFESGKSVFELNEGSHHDHLVCLQCGRVEEFYDAEIERRQNRVAAERGFALHDHSLSLYADCIKADCPHRVLPSILSEGNGNP
jgi:Fur family ferric uptake transcriptional regulator